MNYRIPPRLGWVISEGQPDAGLTVFLMFLPDGEPIVLRDVAALIWIAATEEPDVVSTVAEATQQPRAAVQATVLDYLDELVVQGLVEREPA